MYRFMPFLVICLGLLSSCGKSDDTTNPTPVPTDPTLKLEVNFNNNTYQPLTYTTGRTDNAADADPN